MDFNTQASALAGLSRVAADALVVVIVGDKAPAALDKAVAAALTAAVDAGDLELKPGKTLLLHKAAKVQAARLLLATAADGSAKAFHKAVGAAMGVLKNGGARHGAVALAGAELGAAHAEALALAATDALYVYRHTKPSAPAAAPVAKLTLLCDAAVRPDVEAGLARGAAIAEGQTLARECANRPGNHCTPSFLARARAWSSLCRMKVQTCGGRSRRTAGAGGPPNQSAGVGWWSVQPASASTNTA